MARRKKKGGGGEEVELNMAAMLDMAFQLLTFFILTFRPPPPEGQINLRLPPPKPVSGPGTQPWGKDIKPDEKPKGVETLVISVIAMPANDAKAGDIHSMRVGETDVGTIQQLGNTLERVFSDSTNPFEQVLIQASDNLRYDKLMEVIDVCSKQKMAGEKLKALSFVPLPSAVE